MPLTTYSGRDGFPIERNAGDKEQRGVGKIPRTADWLSSLHKRRPHAVADPHSLFLQKRCRVSV